MPKIEHLKEDTRRKYKIRKQYSIKYTCDCGTEIVYESDEKPKILKKCWKCQNETN